FNARQMLAKSVMQIVADAALLVLADLQNFLLQPLVLGDVLQKANELVYLSIRPQYHLGNSMHMADRTVRPHNAIFEIKARSCVESFVIDLPNAGLICWMNQALQIFARTQIGRGD